MPLSTELSERLAMMEKKMKVQEAESVDMELYEMMKDASQRLQRIKSKTRELKGAQKKSKRKVQALKTERSSEYSTSENTRQLINKTFAELELNGKAHTFEEWCNDCGCIHTEKVLNDAPDVTKHGDEQFEVEQNNVMSNLSNVLNRISQINL
eukprot:TRINITY_DN54152_c0_g1_i1.p1 TRINITY_DN54152_c0_g1~~TRINITY_DN54152_c0_g1_i1.p1  ORF type:complete len:153 (-),score=52.57 TRINITY_DN54152_c0_g1_i1:13-471(-)